MDSIIPNHVAIIMDGNGRWAEIRDLERSKGHKKGTENLPAIVEIFQEIGVHYLTLYAFSTENWARPRKEVTALMNLLLESIASQLDNLNKNNVKLIHLGNKETLSKKVQKAISKAEKITKSNTGLTLSIAFNYGGRDELIGVMKQLIEDGIEPDSINEKTVSCRLYSKGIPDPDLIIRTAGEIRISNFLIWQSAYSEYYFTEVLWPDFNKENVLEALNEYSKRQRKYGSA